MSFSDLPADALVRVVEYLSCDLARGSDISYLPFPSMRYARKLDPPRDVLRLAQVSRELGHIVASTLFRDSKWTHVRDDSFLYEMSLIQTWVQLGGSHIKSLCLPDPYLFESLNLFKDLARTRPPLEKLDLTGHWGPCAPKKKAANIYQLLTNVRGSLKELLLPFGDPPVVEAAIMSGLTQVQSLTIHNMDEYRTPTLLRLLYSMCGHSPAGAFSMMRIRVPASNSSRKVQGMKSALRELSFTALRGSTGLAWGTASSSSLWPDDLARLAPNVARLTIEYNDVHCASIINPSTGERSLGFRSDGILSPGFRSGRPVFAVGDGRCAGFVFFLTSALSNLRSVEVVGAGLQVWKQMLPFCSRQRFHYLSSISFIDCSQGRGRCTADSIQPALVCIGDRLRKLDLGRVGVRGKLSPFIVIKTISLECRYLTHLSVTLDTDNITMFPSATHALVELCRNSGTLQMLGLRMVYKDYQFGTESTNTVQFFLNVMNACGPRVKDLALVLEEHPRITLRHVERIMALAGPRLIQFGLVWYSGGCTQRKNSLAGNQYARILGFAEKYNHRLRALSLTQSTQFLWSKEEKEHVLDALQSLESRANHLNASTLRALIHEKTGQSSLCPKLHERLRRAPGKCPVVSATSEELPPSFPGHSW